MIRFGSNKIKFYFAPNVPFKKAIRQRIEAIPFSNIKLIYGGITKKAPEGIYITLGKTPVYGQIKLESYVEKPSYIEIKKGIIIVAKDKVSKSNVPINVDLVSNIVMHETFHLLGLAHSNNKFSLISKGIDPTKKILQEDIDLVDSLYN